MYRSSCQQGVSSERRGAKAGAGRTSCLLVLRSVCGPGSACQPPTRRRLALAPRLTRSKSFAWSMNSSGISICAIVAVCQHAAPAAHAPHAD